MLDASEGLGDRAAEFFAFLEQIPRKVGKLYPIMLGVVHGPLQNVGKLPNVAQPAVVHQNILRLGADAHLRQSAIMGDLLEQMSGDGQDVFPPFP